MYTTQAQIEAYLKRSLTASELVLLSGLQASVKTYIDNAVQAVFGVVSATTRYYSGNGRVIDIDAATDIASVTLVDSAQTLVYTYDLDLEIDAMPRNDTIKRWIENRSGFFPYGVGNIAVTAQFSMGAVPDDIQMVATIMIGGIFTEGFSPALQSEGIEGYSRTFAVSLATGEISKKKDVIDSIFAKYTEDLSPIL